MRVCQNNFSPRVRKVGREGKDFLRKRSHVADPGGPADLVRPRLGELGREGDSEEQRQERAAAVHRRPWVNLGRFEVGQVTLVDVLKQMGFLPLVQPFLQIQGLHYLTSLISSACGGTPREDVM